MSNDTGPILAAAFKGRWKRVWIGDHLQYIDYELLWDGLDPDG